MKKMLLIHGWGYNHYNASLCTDAWENRKQFVEELGKKFLVTTFNLPGFCGAPDPVKAWNLDDFVAYVDEIIQKEKPDYILGYSFGGAIALRWKYISKDIHTKIILVSPAIVRRKAIQSFFHGISKIIPGNWTNFLRDFYLSHIIKNLYYSRATEIMKETYRSIVVEELGEELSAVTDPILLVYGENDTATPPELVNDFIKGTPHQRIVIPGGGHDIANSHTKEVISAIS